MLPTPSPTVFSAPAVESSVTSRESTAPIVTEEGLSAAARPWRVIVWDDPVNTMAYVSHVFRSYFGYSAEKAEELMLQVHHQGKAQVSQGSREKAETDMMAMHSFGLQATVTQGEHG